MLGSVRRRLAHCHSIVDLRRQAKRRLPRGVFDYIEGGAEDEVTMQRNAVAFGGYELVPRVLVDVEKVDLSTTVLGRQIEWPVVLAPTGLTRLFHHLGEQAVVRAAATAGTIYSLSSVSSVSIEDIAAATSGPKWFQIYVWRDRGILEDFIERCRAGGYEALCLTVDVAALGRRERDLRSGLTIPPRPKLRTVFDTALRPYWLWHFLTSSPVRLANIAGRVETGGEDLVTLAQYTNEQFDPSVTWDDAAWMIEKWNGAFAIKGILSPRDAERAVEIGAHAVIVSNHGGRQLDHAPATIDVLADIVDAVDGRAEVLLDGGIRRGTDVLKALALGARACMIGRPYLYGLGAGGQAGVEHALALLRSEIHSAMRLLGCRSAKELDRSYLRMS